MGEKERENIKKGKEKVEKVGGEKAEKEDGGEGRERGWGEDNKRENWSKREVIRSKKRKHRFGSFSLGFFFVVVV